MMTIFLPTRGSIISKLFSAEAENINIFWYQQFYKRMISSTDLSDLRNYKVNLNA